MIREIKKIATFLILFLLVSCGSFRMNTDDLFKNEKGFELTIWEEVIPYDTTSIKSIHPDSEFIYQLKDWIDKNSSDWIESPYSYTKPIALLKGSNFAFLLYQDSAIINYKDTNGKMRQFSKKVDRERLFFITFLKKTKEDSLDFPIPRSPI